MRFSPFFKTVPSISSTTSFTIKTTVSPPPDGADVLITILLHNILYTISKKKSIHYFLFFFDFVNISFESNICSIFLIIHCIVYVQIKNNTTSRKGFNAFFTRPNLRRILLPAKILFIFYKTHTGIKPLVIFAIRIREA